MTSNASGKQKVPSENPFIDALERLQAKALETVQKHPEERWLPTMRNWATDLRLDFDCKDDDLRTYLSQAQTTLEAPDRDKFILRNGGTFIEEVDVPLLPGFLKQGAMHLFNAEQGAGKSNWCLALFRSLVSDQQTGQFLNLDIPISKNWRLFLVGPDMSQRSWAGPLVNYGLASRDPATRAVSLVPEICYFAPAESGMSLSAEHLAEYRQMAVDAVKQGHKPLFVFDAYNTLLSNFMDVDERTQAFVKPLRALNKAMAGTGATTVVLHHVPKSQSGSTASSGGGHNSLGSVPDVVILLEAAGRNSDRMFLSSAKRIDKTSLIIQQDFENGSWECHGDANEVMARKELLSKIDSLRHPKDKLYDWAEQRWEDQKLPFSSKNVEQVLEISPVQARRHVRVMEANGLFWQCCQERTPGRNLPMYIPAEFKQQYIDAAVQRVERKKAEIAARPCETLEPPSDPLSETGKSTAAQAYETKDGYVRAHAGNQSPAEVPDPTKSVVAQACETLQNPAKQTELTNASETSETNEPLRMHKVPEVNVFGQQVPRKGLQVEDANGENGLYIVEVVNAVDVKVGQLGEPDGGVIRKMRWWMDVFPCGRKAKPGVPL